MSPIGGVGINLAVQDAVAAANVLYGPLREGRVATVDLRKIQQRREFPTRLTQHLQVFIQDRVIRRVLESHVQLSFPLSLRLLRSLPFLQRIPARLIGIGIRPEHVNSLDASRFEKERKAHPLEDGPVF
jgi:2-polyprenyl-6-methoxyphenol hydroxylase-like FAD-dependent oxidoreductase